MTFNPSLTTGVILLTKFLTSTSVELKLHLNFTENNQDLYSVQVWIWPKFSFGVIMLTWLSDIAQLPCWPQLYEVYHPTWIVLTIMFRSQSITFTHIHHLINSSHFGSTRNEKHRKLEFHLVLVWNHTLCNDPAQWYFSAGKKAARNPRISGKCFHHKSTISGKDDGRVFISRFDNALPVVGRDSVDWQGCLWLRESK